MLLLPRLLGVNEQPPGGEYLIQAQYIAKEPTMDLKRWPYLNLSWCLRMAVYFMLDPSRPCFERRIMFFLFFLLLCWLSGIVSAELTL